MGRFLITRASRTEKKTNGHIEAKNAIGVYNRCEQKKSVRAEDQKSSRPDTEHKSGTSDNNRSSKGGNRKTQI